jgi:hypothetical protein
MMRIFSFLFLQNMTGGDNLKSRAAYSREGRKQLFAVLQSARGSSGDCPFEYAYMLEHNVYMFLNIFTGKRKGSTYLCSFNLWLCVFV